MLSREPDVINDYERYLIYFLKKQENRAIVCSQYMKKPKTDIYYDNTY